MQPVVSAKLPRECVPVKCAGESGNVELWALLLETAVNRRFGWQSLEARCHCQRKAAMKDFGAGSGCVTGGTTVPENARFRDPANLLLDIYPHRIRRLAIHRQHQIHFATSGQRARQCADVDLIESDQIALRPGE